MNAAIFKVRSRKAILVELTVKTVRNPARIRKLYLNLVFGRLPFKSCLLHDKDMVKRSLILIVFVFLSCCFVVAPVQYHAKPLFPESQFHAEYLAQVTNRERKFSELAILCYEPKTRSCNLVNLPKWRVCVLTDRQSLVNQNVLVRCVTKFSNLWCSACAPSAKVLPQLSEILLFIRKVNEPMIVIQETLFTISSPMPSLSKI